MYCILIAGLPAAGKTTISESLSQSLNLPVLSKDKIKELLYDTVGFTGGRKRSVWVQPPWISCIMRPAS